MDLVCPYCAVSNDPASDCRNFKNSSPYHRKSDGRTIQRFKCRICSRTFSRATFHPCYRQNKRHKNFEISKALRSNVSQRRTAENCNVTRKTVNRKLLFLGKEAARKLAEMNQERGPVDEADMDEQFSFIHTKMKPATIHLVVEGEREILGLISADAPANGKLAKRSIKKYGKRHDGRKQARRELLRRIAPFIKQGARFKTDENPHYTKDIEDLLPGVTHEIYKGRKPREYGNDELKEGGFDPLFNVNHTSASFRANTSCLIRKTWNTTKKRECLEAHMYIYAVYQNEKIQKNRKKKATKLATC